MAKKTAVCRKEKNVFEFKISLANTKPLVWRKVLAHEFIELGELHLLFQIAMGWNNCHLHAFEINGKTYSDEETAQETNALLAEGVILCDVLGNSKSFTYSYDFGDDWKHNIEITDILKHDSRMNYPICIGGENACPPEDCGGPCGFENLNKVIAGKDCKEKDELLTWLGGYYNPSTFDPNFVNKILWKDEDF